MGNTEQRALTDTGPSWLAGVMGSALRWVALPGVAIGTLAGVGIATGGVGSTAVLAALADPASVFAARSPGTRAPGALTQTKQRKASTSEERVLSNVLTRPLDRFAAPRSGADAPGLTPAPAVGDTVTDAVSDATAPGSGDTGPSGPILSGFIPSIGGIVVIAPGVGGTPGGAAGGGGGGGGGTGGGGDTTTPVTPVNPAIPVASVPEPATWLTLFLGFGAIGGALRSRRREPRGASGPVFARG